MLINTIKEITHISEDENINSENYLEAITYINNAYTILNLLKGIVPNDISVHFRPTFKGIYTCFVV